MALQSQQILARVLSVILIALLRHALNAPLWRVQDLFLETHGVKLGFMSAFVKASADALLKVPAVNAVIDGDEIIYRDYTDISIAVVTPKGLVVPVLRNVDNLSFAEVEKVCLCSLCLLILPSITHSLPPVDMQAITLTQHVLKGCTHSRLDPLAFVRALRHYPASASGILNEVPVCADDQRPGQEGAGGHNQHR